jgi:tetratricopeptide (TPR) repeat protein
MNYKIALIWLVSMLGLSSVYGQNTFRLELNGLTDIQKVEAYLGQASRLDGSSDILFLIYAVQRASEILAEIDNSQVTKEQLSELEASLSYQWARIYLFVKQYDLAVQSLESSLRLARGNFLQRRAMLLLIDVRMEQGSYTEALSAIDRLLAQDIRDLQRYYTLVHQARVLRALEQPVRARESANRALSIAQQELEADGYDALLELGQIAHTLGEHDLAMNQWNLAYDVAARQSNNYNMSQALFLIAELNQNLEFWSESYYYAQRALLHLAGEDRQMLFADIHHLLANYYLYSNDASQAFISLNLMYQVRTRVVEQQSLSAQLALSLSLLQESNALELNELTSSLRMQRIISIIQIALIILLTIILFMVSRRSWESASLQRIAQLAYRTLAMRVSRSQGTLNVQVAKMLAKEYSFGVVIAKVDNEKDISILKDGHIILELALDELKQKILHMIAPMEEAPTLKISALDHLVFFYFDDVDGHNFEQDIHVLKREHVFQWQGSAITLELSYHKYFYHHQLGSDERKNLLDWLEKKA